MSISFVDVVTQSITSTSLVIDRPSGVVEGDLIYVYIVKYNGNVTLPDSSWAQHLHPNIVEEADAITAFKYASASEPSTYAFTVDAGAGYAALVVYRGVICDLDFDPMLYPHGFFAPAGSTCDYGGSTGSPLTSGDSASTAVTDVLVLYVFMQYHPSLTPVLSDVSPPEPIRSNTSVPNFGLEIVDVTYPSPTDPVGQLSVVSSITSSFASNNVVWVSLEPAPEEPSSLDNYKAKLMRRMLPPPLDQRFASTNGKILTIIGQSDNIIGGLFGDADFLPDEDT